MTDTQPLVCRRHFQADCLPCTWSQCKSQSSGIQCDLFDGHTPFSVDAEHLYGGLSANNVWISQWEAKALHGALGLSQQHNADSVPRTIPIETPIIGDSVHWTQRKGTACIAAIITKLYPHGGASLYTMHEYGQGTQHDRAYEETTCADVAAGKARGGRWHWPTIKEES